jgi:hypothetical protein
MRGVRVGWLAVVAGVTLSACGGDTTARSMAGPSTVINPAPTAPLPTGTVLGVSSAETGGAIEGATLVLSGHSYTSDASGNVSISGGAVPGALLELRSPDSLDRDTVLRAPGSARFTLWPRRSPTGLDEAYTKAVVYTWDDDKGGGTSPLYRLSSTQAALVPSSELMNDPLAMAAHQRAADAINAGSGGQVRYVVAGNPPPGAIPVATVLDPRDGGCKDRVLAFTSIRLRGGEISSARIVFCNLQAARDGTVTHEAGHSFGLGHSPDADEVMHAFKMARQADTFGARESLVMRLMLQRHGGNRFPDNDRGVSAASSGEVKIICR